MKLKAFSLLEIIIVLAILATLMGIGWSGLINFRSTTELQNAYSELLSVTKSVQNKAKNSISANSNGQTPDFYTMFFSNNRYYAFTCSKSGSLGQTVTCQKDTTITFRLLPADIKIIPDAKCVGIGFTRLSGKFASFNLPVSNIESLSSFSTTYVETGLCNLKITHTGISSEKIIEINFDLSNINAK